jgi:hypothetical protein
MAWLRAHPAPAPRVIAYDVHRCCGGGKVCLVSVRGQNAQDSRGDFDTGALADGTEVLIDHRAARRLPSQVRLTVRGIGPLRHLDLDLTGEQWGALLYD